jgi:hypothetical protein
VNTSTATTAPDSLAPPTYQERTYPQIDCIGVYIWIWERLRTTETGTEVIARRVDRNPPGGQASCTGPPDFRSGPEPAAQRLHARPRPGLVAMPIAVGVIIKRRGHHPRMPD